MTRLIVLVACLSVLSVSVLAWQDPTQAVPPSPDRGAPGDAPTINNQVVATARTGLGNQQNDVKPALLNTKIQGPDNRDRLSNSIMHTLPLKSVLADHRTGRDGQYLPTRVISTVSPVVVRRNDPQGASYQEGIGYSFLLNSPKYPGLCRMDNGTLVLTLTASLSGEVVRRNEVTFVDENTRTDVILFSRDNGMSWSSPQRIPGYRTTPMNLGGQRLMLRGWNSKVDVPETYRFWFSEDAGQTWSDEEEVAALPDGRRPITDVAPNMLIEGNTIRFMFYVSGGTVMRTYNHVRHTWDEPYFFSKPWMDFARCSEASLARAGNGDLVASFRSSRPGIPSPSDHWRSILTARSTDDGETWTTPDVHSLYGHVHHSLLTLPDGRILMTFAARLGELDGRLYHGHEAVLSHDHGKTWDWKRRYILFRGTDGSMHSPRSVWMDNQRVLTIVMHPVSFTWRDGQTKGNLMALSHVSAVIWKP